LILQIPQYSTVKKKPKGATEVAEDIYQVPGKDENALYAQLNEIFTNVVTRGTVS
jgi:hypothetical protein